MAQLVSKGYAQTYDVDYFETCPIAKLASICFAHLTRCFGEFGIPSNQIWNQGILVIQCISSGIEASKSKSTKGIFLIYWKYVLNVLSKVGMLC